jgi:hypothetical protein
MRNRQEYLSSRRRNSLIRLIRSKHDLRDADIELIHEFVFALCWSRETHALATAQMQPVIALNKTESDWLCSPAEEPPKMGGHITHNQRPRLMYVP